VFSLILIGGLYMLCIYITSFSLLLLYSIVTVLRSRECATIVHLAFEILLLIKVHVLVSKLSK